MLTQVDQRWRRGRVIALPWFARVVEFPQQLRRPRLHHSLAALHADSAQLCQQDSLGRLAYLNMGTHANFHNKGDLSSALIGSQTLYQRWRNASKDYKSLDSDASS